MGPIGLVSVSPVARQHTIEIRNERATAINPSGIEMWNASDWTITNPIVMGIRPATSHEIGTSMASIADGWLLPHAGFPRRLNTENARPIVRHCSASDARLEKTMTAVPPQRPHLTGLKLKLCGLI